MFVQVSIIKHKHSLEGHTLNIVHLILRSSTLKRNELKVYISLKESKLACFTNRRFISGTRFQSWESAAGFGNAVVNVVLSWFYDSKKNAAVKVFTYAVFLFRFYSVVDNS